jgi:outer membrane protein assembly factor BamB
MGKIGVQLLRVDLDGKESVLHQHAEAKRAANRLLVAACPVIDPERRVVYFVTNGDRDGMLHAWSVPDQRLKWSEPFPSAIRAAPTVASDGSIVVADLAGWVHALAPDRTRRYRYATGGEYLLAGGVCDQRGTVFIGDPLGVVHAIPSHGGGKPLWETTGAIQARPAFDAEGNLYVPATDRQVLVFANRAG